MAVIIEKQFLQIVEDALSERGWSRTDLANEIGISRQMVTDYLNGRKKAGPEVMERFLEALELEPDFRARPKNPTPIS